MVFYKLSNCSLASPIPLFISEVAAGFPSPADDYIEKELDLNEYLIKHPSSTFIARAKGFSMINAGIQDGDLMIIDKSLRPYNNSVVVAVINGEFTVKRIKLKNSNLYLVPENSDFAEISITEDMNFQVWGVVVYIIHKI